ncbi:MAG: hypothetical protein OQL06_05175 [Gammaproteobacteria bacterium]|nr:hypothetical protein [Gammaproteobacteria bacterium]
MKIDNPLSRDYLLHYPSEAARVLEQVSVDHVAALLGELPVQQIVPVMAAMLPKKAAACIAAMPASSAARLVIEMPIAAAARSFRLLAPAYQDELLKYLSEKKRRQLQRYLIYPSSSAGALVDSDVDVLPVNMTVNEAIRQLKQFDHPVRYGIYIVNEKYQLVGIVDSGKMLISDLHARLKDIMIPKVQSISAHVNYETLLQHPGWQSHRRLPVLERDNTLIGILHQHQLQEVMGDTGSAITVDPVDDFLSLASLYWLSLAQFLDGILSTHSSKGER